MRRASVLTTQQVNRLAVLREEEDTTFDARTRRSHEMSQGAQGSMVRGVPMGWMAGLYQHRPVWVRTAQAHTFTDVDSHTYLDFNLSDMSTVAGFTHPLIVQAGQEQFGRGVQYLLPTADALAVTDNLSTRFGLPFWQYTLSASQAVQEALRIARVATGRTGILMFAGKYHGHIDDTLWSADENGRLVAESLTGRPAPPKTGVVAFGDISAVRAALATRSFAAVLAEPALTNIGTVVAPEGFFDDVRRLCDQAGTLLLIDETHTQFDVYGGLTRLLGLQPDMVIGGKGIAGGIPIGAYGMRPEIADVLAAHPEIDGADEPGIATGGTLFANALSLRCANVCLTDVLTESRHRHMSELGARLADGLEAIFAAHRLPWRAHRLGARTGYCLTDELPRTAAEAELSLDPMFTDTRKVFFANRHVWDSIASSGPHVGAQHSQADIDTYLDVAEAFVKRIASGAVLVA